MYYLFQGYRSMIHQSYIIPGAHYNIYPPQCPSPSYPIPPSLAISSLSEEICVGRTLTLLLHLSMIRTQADKLGLQFPKSF